MIGYETKKPFIGT